MRKEECVKRNYTEICMKKYNNAAILNEDLPYQQEKL